MSEMRRTPRGQAKLAHQPVGEVCRGGEALGSSGAHRIRLEADRLDHAGHGADTEVERVEGLEGEALVVLQVLGIGERQGLDGALQGAVIRGDERGLGAHEFSRVRVALLRHDGTAG